jgi:hypothetical protein
LLFFIAFQPTSRFNLNGCKKLAKADEMIENADAMIEGGIWHCLFVSFRL